MSYFIDVNADSRLADLFYLDEDSGKLEVRLNEEINNVLDRDEGTTYYEIGIIFRDNYRQGSNSRNAFIFYKSVQFSERMIIMEINDVTAENR